jgi:hypothetical protein
MHYLPPKSLDRAETEDVDTIRGCRQSPLRLEKLADSASLNAVLTPLAHDHPMDVNLLLGARRSA